MSHNYETMKILGSLYSQSLDLDKRDTARVNILYYVGNNQTLFDAGHILMVLF